MLRIALIDGDAAIRAGRKLMIDAQHNLQLIYEESDAEIALSKVPELLVDVAVIDHRLKGFDGIELTRRLVTAFSEKKEKCPSFIITGTYATPELVLAAIRCGASDVVTQDAPMSELLTAINNSANEVLYPDFSSFDDVLSHADYQPKPDPLVILRRSQLSQEQKEFLDLLDQGLSLAEVQTSRRLQYNDFKVLLESILLDLHLATVEQLYLALHDSRANTKDV